MPRVRVTIVAPVALASAIGLAVAAACLPDLPAVAPAPICGDGIIDPDAGEECDPGVDGSTAACVLCRVNCTSISTVAFVDPTTNHCYISKGTTQSIDGQDGGEPACESIGAHVVRYVSSAESLYVAAHDPTTPVWVGIKSTTTHGEYLALPDGSIEPGWSPTCTGCFAQVPAGATSIPVNTMLQEAGVQGFENCVISDVGTAPWTQSVCSGIGEFERETICEREPVGTRSRACGSSACFTVVATQGTKRYTLVPGSVSSSGAANQCPVGAHLAVFGSREEREQVAYEVATQTVTSAVTSFWIGGVSPDVLGENQPATVDAGASPFVSLTPGLVDTSLARWDFAGESGPHAALCETTW